MHTNPDDRSEATDLDQPTPDPDVYVRRGAARNPSCPADALAALAKDSDVYVRWGAAENPSCPADALAAIAGVRREGSTSDGGAL